MNLFLQKGEFLSVEEEKIHATIISDISEDDYDAQRLKDLGYKQEFSRDISLFVQAGFSFSTMAVLPNWLVGDIRSIYASIYKPVINSC